MRRLWASGCVGCGRADILLPNGTYAILPSIQMDKEASRVRDDTEELLLAIESIVKREVTPLVDELRKINIRLDTEITDRLDSLADGFLGLNEKRRESDARLDQVDGRLDRIETDAVTIKSAVSRNDRDIAALKRAQ